MHLRCKINSTYLTFDTALPCYLGKNNQTTRTELRCYSVASATRSLFTCNETRCFCAHTMSRMRCVRFNPTLTVHKLDDVYENHRSIWMTVADNLRRFRHRIHAGGILHGRNCMLRRRKEVVFRAYCETKLQVERLFAEEMTYLGRFCR